MFGYKVTTGTPTTDVRGIVGEWIFEGKRGATYLSVRENTDDKTVAFWNPRSVMNPWVALKGNYTMPVTSVERCAVTLNDADRVA